jgi:hypothetical protein
MHGDPETGDPVGQGGDWVFIAFLHCLKVEMSLRYRQRFAGKERCLLDHLPPLGPPAVHPSVPYNSIGYFTLVLSALLNVWML